MSYHLAADEVSRLRAFRNKRVEFAAHVLIGDLVTTYPLMKVCEKMDKAERWHWTHAIAAIEDSHRQFMDAVYMALPPQSRRAHDPRWLPSE